jgi:hypothetical protein
MSSATDVFGIVSQEWITNPNNGAALRAKLLFMEVTFLDHSRTADDARRFGHTHLSEVVQHAHLFQVKTNPSLQVGFAASPTHGLPFGHHKLPRRSSRSCSLSLDVFSLALPLSL